MRTARTKAVELYFRGQVLATVALFAFVGSAHYTLVYVAATVLMLELCVFLLWDEGVRKWSSGLLPAAVITDATAFGMTGIDTGGIITLTEEFFVAVIGVNMLKSWSRCRNPYVMLGIGTLAMAQCCYDALYLVHPEWDAGLNQWLPSMLCTAVFSVLAFNQWRERWART